MSILKMEVLLMKFSSDEKYEETACFEVRLLMMLYLFDKACFLIIHVNIIVDVNCQWLLCC